MQGKRVSFFSFRPTFGQRSNTKEGVKELNTIAVVTKFSHKYYNIQIGDGIDIKIGQREQALCDICVYSDDRSFTRFRKE